MELTMYRQFQLGAAVRHSSVPAGDEAIDWLPLMQHYGLPTRLLDWTGSPLVAAFFAVNESPGEHAPACVWAFSPGRYNELRQQHKGVLRLWNKQSVASMGKLLTKRPNRKGKNTAATPVQFDLRMLMQDSCFTVHDSVTPLEDEKEAGEFLMRFHISAEGRECLELELKLCNIRLSTLFPDLEHLAQDAAGK